jgi:hypothetical protein
MIRRGRPPSAARHRPRGTRNPPPPPPRGLWLCVASFFFSFTYVRLGVPPYLVHGVVRCWDGESCICRRSSSSGGERSARTERATQRWVWAAAAELVPLGRVRAGTGGIPDVGPTAGSMAEEATFAGFDTLMRGYQEYQALSDPQAHAAFIKGHASYTPVLGVPQ